MSYRRLKKVREETGVYGGGLYRDEDGRFLQVCPTCSSTITISLDLLSHATFIRHFGCIECRWKD